MVEYQPVTWLPATLVLCLTNDFVWWLPFALYLRDAWPFFRRDWKIRNPGLENNQS